MIPAAELSTLAVIGLASFAVATDLRSGRIPNRLTLPALGLGVTLGAIEGGAPGLALSLAGAATGAAFLLAPAAYGAIGGGDLKFQAAVGALMGPLFAAVSLGLAGLFGGAMALAYVAWHVAARRSRVRDALRHGLPYAPALASGVVGALLLRHVV